MGLLNKLSSVFGKRTESEEDKWIRVSACMKERFQNLNDKYLRKWTGLLEEKGHLSSFPNSDGFLLLLIKDQVLKSAHEFKNKGLISDPDLNIFLNALKETFPPEVTTLDTELMELLEGEDLSNAVFKFWKKALDYLADMPPDEIPDGGSLWEMVVFCHMSYQVQTSIERAVCISSRENEEFFRGTLEDLCKKDSKYSFWVDDKSELGLPDSSSTQNAQDEKIEGEVQLATSFVDQLTHEEFDESDPNYKYRKLGLKMEAPRDQIYDEIKAEFCRDGAEVQVDSALLRKVWDEAEPYLVNYQYLSVSHFDPLDQYVGPLDRMLVAIQVGCKASKKAQDLSFQLTQANSAFSFADLNNRIIIMF